MRQSKQPDDKRDLLSAYDRVVAREKARSLEAAGAGPALRRTRTWVVILGIGAWGMLAWTWLAKPAWLFPPDPATLASPAQREATLRFAIYLTADRIREYRVENRVLPARLEDAGDVEAGVTYTVTGDTTFTLTGKDGSIEVTWQSTEPMGDFLAPAGISPAPPD